MVRLALSGFALIGVLTALVQADTALPVQTLTEIKGATVFIRITKDKLAGSGTGFVIRTDGDTAYVATNEHVAVPTFLVERKTPVIGPRPITPKIGAGPNIQYKTELVEVPVPNPTITVVFNSGSKDERAATAQVVAADPDLDLAVLRVTGLKGLPKPIAQQPPKLVETMTVFTFGYPFGKGLALDRGNPAITVGRGAVSSIRNTKSGEIGLVQIDGDVNPGNSGGPVVDEKGNLVGIVVGKIRDTKIGMAIPTQDLLKLLAGRVGQAKFTPGNADKGQLDVSVELGLMDPMEKIKGLTLHFVPTSAVTEAAKKDGLAKLPEAKKVELKREQGKAVGTISVAVPEKGNLPLTYQVSYVNGDGKTMVSQTRDGLIKLATQTAALPSTPDPTPKPSPKPTPSTPAPKTAPATKIEEPFDAPSIRAALRQSKPGDRGAVVAATLAPLQKNAIRAGDLLNLIEDLQNSTKAQAAVKRLHNTQPDSKRQAEVARLVEKVASNKDATPFARADAATALRWWGTPESAEVLIPMVTDSSNVHSIHYRHPAMWSLAYMGSEKGVEAIAGRIENNVDRAGVVKILEQMGSVTEPQVIKLLDHRAPEIRAEAAKILKTVGTKECGEKLIGIAEKDPNEKVRQQAREALAAIAARQK